VVGRKVTRTVPRTRAVTATSARRRPHSLAPEHVGEAGSVAVLALAVLGLSAFIAGVAIAVTGLTVSGRFGTDPPPNAGDLGIGQVLGGSGVAVLGLLLTGTSLAVLADVRRSRIVAAVVAGLSAVVCAIGVVLVASAPSGGPVLPSALAVTCVILAASAFILGRPRR